MEEKHFINCAFGIAVRECRNARGLGLKGISVLTGIDESNIIKVEKGVRGPELRTIFKLSNGLNVLPEDLVRRTREIRITLK